MNKMHDHYLSLAIKQDELDTYDNTYYDPTKICRSWYANETIIQPTLILYAENQREIAKANTDSLYSTWDGELD